MRDTGRNLCLIALVHILWDIDSLPLGFFKLLDSLPQLQYSNDPEKGPERFGDMKCSKISLLLLREFENHE